MSVLRSYSRGLAEAGRRPKMLGLLWLLNFAFAAVAYFVFHSALRGALGDSLAAGALLRKTDTDVVFEFLTSSGTVLGEILTVLVVLIVLHVLLSIFVTGGILAELAPESRGVPFGQVFFGGGGRFYGRFFRLAVYSLVLWVPAGVIFMMANALLGIATQNPAREQLAFVLGFVRAALLLFLVFYIKMIVDYARIKIALTDSREVFRSLVGAARFVFGRFAKTLVLYYLLGLTALAAYGVYLAVEAMFSKISIAAVLAGFFIAQVFILSRAWMRVAFQASQKSYLETARS